MSLIYTIIKDVAEWLKWKELEPKLVEYRWLEESGKREDLEREGIEASWCAPEKLERRLAEGYEVIFELDSTKRTRRCWPVRRF